MNIDITAQSFFLENHSVACICCRLNCGNQSCQEVKDCLRETSKIYHLYVYNLTKWPFYPFAQYFPDFASKCFCLSLSECSSIGNSFSIKNSNVRKELLRVWLSSKLFKSPRKWKYVNQCIQVWFTYSTAYV